METAELRLKLSTNGDIMEEKNIDREVLMSVDKNAHIGLQSISNVIDETVELYGESLKLTALCRRQLDEAKIKITEVGGNEQL